MTPAIALEILANHNAFLATAASALEHAKKAGELLIEAKGPLKHGEWLPWLEVHLPEISPRTAQGYMQLARGWPQLLEIRDRSRICDGYLGIRDALTILADEWNDPDELGAGGSNDNSDDETNDDEDEDEDNPNHHKALFTVPCPVDEYPALRKQFDALKPLFRTHTKYDTFKKLLQLVHSAMAPGDGTKDDDADDPIDRRELDARS